MLRWLSFFGALALVAAGVVFFLYKGPPPTPFPDWQFGDKKEIPEPEKKILIGQPAPPAPAPAPAGPWKDVMAITPRVVIPGARLAAVRSPQVPAMREGQLLFLGTEVKEGEKPPPDAIPQEMVYLVTEVQPGETWPQKDLIAINGRSYRPLGPRDEVRPNRIRLAQKQKWFVPVDEGTPVQAGQLLGLIDPSLAVDELSSKLAKLEAAEAERLASEKIRDFEEGHYRRLVALGPAATKEEVYEAKAGWERYMQETVSKGEALKVAGRELRQTETILGLHEIRSRVGGRVKQLIKHPSESVRSLDPVLEVVDLSKLRVRARVDLQDLDSLPDPNNPQDKRVVEVEATRLVPPQRVLRGHMGEVTGVAVSKDNRVVSVSDDSTLRVWDPKQQRPQFMVRQSTPVRAVACTGPKAENVNLCLTGAADGIARLYDLAADKFVRSFEGGHKAAISSVAFAPDGRWAVTGGEDRAICLWDVDGGTLLHRFPIDMGHKDGVTSVAFLTSGPEDNPRLSVVSAGRDYALLVWPLRADGSPEKPERRDRRVGEVATLGVNSKGNQLLFDQGRELRVLSADSGALVGSLSATGGTSFSRLALFSPDGNLILASGGGGRLGLWRAPTTESRGHELEQLVWTSSRDEQAATNCGAFAPDGSFLVTGTQGRNVIVWPMPKKEDVERRLTARVFNRDPEVNNGTVRVLLELVDPPSYLLPGDAVTLVVYPEK